MRVKSGKMSDLHGNVRPGTFLLTPVRLFFWGLRTMGAFQIMLRPSLSDKKEEQKGKCGDIDLFLKAA